MAGDFPALHAWRDRRQHLLLERRIGVGVLHQQPGRVDAIAPDQFGGGESMFGDNLFEPWQVLGVDLHHLPDILLRPVAIADVLIAGLHPQQFDPQIRQACRGVGDIRRRRLGVQAGERRRARAFRVGGGFPRVVIGPGGQHQCQQYGCGHPVVRHRIIPVRACVLSAILAGSPSSPGTLKPSKPGSAGWCSDCAASKKKPPRQAVSLSALRRQTAYFFFGMYRSVMVPS